MLWVKRRLFISSADPEPTAASACSTSLTLLPLAGEALWVGCPVTAGVKLRERTATQLNQRMMWLRMILLFSAAQRARHTCPGQPEGLAYALALEFGG